MAVSSALSAALATSASPEGFALARGFLYLVALLAVWIMIAALSQIGKVVTALLRATLVAVVLVALGAAAVAVLAQLALILQLG